MHRLNLAASLGVSFLAVFLFAQDSWAPPVQSKFHEAPATQGTQSPHIPMVQPTPRTEQPVLQPVDLTNPTNFMGNLTTMPTGNFDALAGISETRGFPTTDALRGTPDHIVIHSTGGDGDVLKRESPYTVTLERGTILASVRRPSFTGMVFTAIGDVAFSANTDAFVTMEKGVLRVRNVDGMGQVLKVRINQGPGKGKALVVAPGHELVLADHKLTREEARPSDGILRRGTHVLDGQQAAVSEYYVQGALENSALVAHLSKMNNDDRAKRIVQDMSRMAAVLNHLNGTQEFTQQ